MGESPAAVFFSEVRVEAIVMFCSPVSGLRVSKFGSVGNKFAVAGPVDDENGLLEGPI